MNDQDKDMVVFLHDLARTHNSEFIRKIADRFNALAKKKELPQLEFEE